MYGRTETAVELDADSSKFPEGWLFPHRWSKGKKDASLSFTMVHVFARCNSSRVF